MEKNEVNILDFQNITDEEIEERKKEFAKKVEEKGFLPINEGYKETMHTSQEEVEKQPRKFIIEECIPACQDCGKKIYIHLW